MEYKPRGQNIKAFDENLYNALEFIRCLTDNEAYLNEKNAQKAKDLKNDDILVASLNTWGGCYNDIYKQIVYLYDYTERTCEEALNHLKKLTEEGRKKQERRRKKLGF